MNDLKIGAVSWQTQCNRIPRISAHTNIPLQMYNTLVCFCNCMGIPVENAIRLRLLENCLRYIIRAQKLHNVLRTDSVFIGMEFWGNY